MSDSKPFEEASLLVEAVTDNQAVRTMAIERRLVEGEVPARRYNDFLAILFPALRHQLRSVAARSMAAPYKNWFRGWVKAELLVLRH